MKLRQLEKDLLAPRGFTFCRQRGSHRVYKDADGRVLVIAATTPAKTFSRGELAGIRRSLARLQEAGMSADACSRPPR